MSLLDLPQTEVQTEQCIQALLDLEEELAAFLNKGSVICSTATDIPELPKKLRNLYGAPIDEDSVASKIQSVVKNSSASVPLSSHKDRRFLSIDFRGLKRGDAWGLMKSLSKDDNDLILVWENVTRIPKGDPSLFDDKDFVEDLLIKSWMHEDINVGDFHIDRRNLTIILTCPTEDSEKMKKLAQNCHYSFDDSGRLETILEYLLSK